MDIDLASLGQRIRERRIEKRLSQEDAAELAGMNMSYLSQLEGAKVPNPGLRVIQRLAHALDTSMAYLVNETDDPRPPSKASAAAPNREAGVKDGDPVPPDLQLNIERAMLRVLRKWEQEGRPKSEPEG